MARKLSPIDRNSFFSFFMCEEVFKRDRVEKNRVTKSDSSEDQTDDRDERREVYFLFARRKLRDWGSRDSDIDTT